MTDISDVERASLADPVVMGAVAEARSGDRTQLHSRAPLLDLTGTLEDAREAAQAWSVAKPRTAKRNDAAAAAIEAYVRVDVALFNGASLPGGWARSVVLPSVEEVAEALAAVGMMMPIEQTPVKQIAAQVVEVMRRRRSPR